MQLALALMMPAVFVIGVAAGHGYGVARYRQRIRLAARHVAGPNRARATVEAIDRWLDDHDATRT